MNKLKSAMKHHRLFSALLALALLWIAFILIAPLIAPHDPLATDFAHVLLLHSAEYPLGTDQLGRCVLSRILYGARTSLSMTFLMIGIVFVLGVAIGMVSGFFGGFSDTVLMRLCDTLMAFPGIIFAIAVVGALGPGLMNTVIALAVIWWTKYARVTRSLIVSIRQKEYIAVAALGGARYMKIVFHYMLPNMLSPLVVMAMLDVGGMLISISGLSFLGLGSQPPAPEWGAMLNEGRKYLQTAPWLLIYPGLAIFCTVLIFNLLGDSVRDVLDPKEISLHSGGRKK
ncbi:nickel ABC transporter permease subunit NikC [Paenibacillus sp. FSL H7-0326]|uniref:nickel transporter permease n=1 Tax=Paenibacillus sp. FSL H7-0326 TaxID=1921144 RepID=UPI00096D6B8C|nr:nickel transporter permease [Paenibacillus sp. FSL H7-0326]OMC71403.1 nickel ABC transporter permease subunit NikC [Paenibacillus sp. FSL H7-0326]